MSELTDLEIRKQITLMLINDKFPKAASIEYDDRQLCFWVETSGFSSWPLENPLTDDALCFQLMIKHQIDFYHAVYADETIRRYEAVNAITGKGFGFSSSANKVICLAIIELHK